MLSRLANLVAPRLAVFAAPTRLTARRLLVLLLFAGAVFRFQGLNWDQHRHLHPDERFISMVEEKLEGPSTIGHYFDSSSSPLNPYNRGHASFVYGTFPMFLAKGIGAAIGSKGYDGTYLPGRFLSGLFDLLSAWLAYLIVRRFTARGPALAAAGLLAFCPLGVQLSHFWTVDTFLTTFTTAALLGGVRIAQGRSTLLQDAATGAALGFAVACKVTGLALILPVFAAVLTATFSATDGDSKKPLWQRVVRAAARSAAILAGAAMTVRIALPYAFLGPSPFSFQLDPRWVEDLKRLATSAGSVAGSPPSFQWAGRTILFPLRNIVLWGAGPFFGLAALAALAWAAVNIWKRRRLPLLPLFLHAIFLIAYHGLTMAKSMRYFYPVYPALAVLAVLLLREISLRAEGTDLRRRLLRALPAAAVAGTFLCALAFTSIYRREHPRIAASRWIYENAVPPQPVLNETWDDGLPLSQPGYDPGQYSGPQPNVISPDNPQKVEEMVSALEKADWIAVTSNRAYGSLTRIPDVFPMTRAYYSALFEGRLGFDRAADFRSYPSLGPLDFPDDRAEEAFSVYDHPRVLLFRKSRSFSADRVRQILLAAMPSVPPTLHDWERLPRSKRHVAASLVPARGEPGTVAAPRTVGVAMEAGSLRATFLWYVTLVALGLIAAPIASAIFSSFSDRGYGFAKILGLAATTYVMAVTTRIRLLPNGRVAAWVCLGVFAAVAGILFRIRRLELRSFFERNAARLLAGEVAFAIGFFLFLGIRALNPEIYWGEKPMDFSILNILVRTRTFPPSDPWFAGASLGYYTFGQQMIAFLTLLTGLPTNLTFNLAFGLLGGITLQTAFSLGREWAGSPTAGWWSAALMALVGNLSGLREWLVNKRALDWHYFWATSRVVPDTINEYPFWSLLFADLHAHLLAMPLLLLFAGCALHFVRVSTSPESTAGRHLGAAVFLGVAAGVEALTNAWDVPMLAGLFVLVALVSGAGNGMRAPVFRVVSGFVTAATAAVLTVAPLWVRGGGAPGYGWNTGAGGRPLDVALVFGLFFFLAFGWWLASSHRMLAEEGLSRWRRTTAVALLAALLAALVFQSAELICAAGVLFFVAAAFRMVDAPERRLAAGLLATAFFLVLFPQRMFIYDRMNTYFKLYFAAWILFAISTAVLVFSKDGQAGSFARWKLPARVAFLALVAVGLFTSVTAARGVIDSRLGRPGPADYRGTPGFIRFGGASLDGLRYLAALRPGEYRAVMWLRRSVSGTPVVLEAQGASYQDFSRISMNTGLPTVLGWEHHVKQRGNLEEDIASRREAVEWIYSSTDAKKVEALLRRYHVGYVYVGWLERKTYPADGLRKFDTTKDLFELAYSNPDVRIYRVIGGDSEDVITPARESLPEPAPGQEVVETEEPPTFLETPDPARPPFSGMREPRDGAFDAQGRLWVADFGNSRLRVFDREGGYLGGWGGRGDGTFSMREPCAVAIGDDEIYLADTWNNRVQLFSIAGEWKARVTEFFGPRGIAAGPDGTVWITDTGNNRLVFYDSRLQERKTTGALGAGNGEFSGPVGIAVGPEGRVYVADVGNHRIQVLDSTGRFQAAWPFPGWKEWGEAHLEADEKRVYVSDPGANAVVVFDTAGAVVRRFGAEEATPPLSRPTGIALDPKNRVLYVVNSGTPGVSRIDLSAFR